jgi:uncharacterized protein YkwD
MGRGISGSLVATFAVAATLAVPATAAAPSDVRAVESLKRSILAEINAVRRAHGLAPVRGSVALDRAAGGHSRAMATVGFFSHTSPDGTVFWKRIARSYSSRGYDYWTVGENLLWSSAGLDGARVVRMWLNSPPHRRVLLNRLWREAGISAVHTSAAPGDFGGGEATIVTADFGQRR